MSISGFTAPFNAPSRSGERSIPDWNVYGNAKVLQNFVRLTDAHEHKQGTIVSTKVLDVDQFSAIFKFRISGHEKINFGEGLALWVVDTDATIGPFHGFTDAFVGFGLIFDNFKGTEAAHSHTDVTLLVNDGTRTRREMLADHLGCPARMRYHEGRADFSTFNATRVSISYKPGVLTIGLDPRNKNEWMECVTSYVKLPEGWLQKAKVAITASTGDRVDNHDVLAFKLFPFADDIRTAGIEDVSVPARETLDHLVQHLEHQLAAVQATIQGNIKTVREQEARSQERLQKLEDSLMLKLVQAVEARIKGLENLNLKQLHDQEAQAETRISKLEETLNVRVHHQMEQRLVDLQRAVDSANMSEMESRVVSLEKVLQDSLEARLTKLEEILRTQIEDHVDLVEGTSHTYGLPFGVLSVVIVGSLVWLWWKYRGLKKRCTL